MTSAGGGEGGEGAPAAGGEGAPAEGGGTSPEAAIQEAEQAFFKSVDRERQKMTDDKARALQRKEAAAAAEKVQATSSFSSPLLTLCATEPTHEPHSLRIRRNSRLPPPVCDRRRTKWCQLLMGRPRPLVRPRPPTEKRLPLRRRNRPPQSRLRRLPRHQQKLQPLQRRLLHHPNLNRLDTVYSCLKSIRAAVTVLLVIILCLAIFHSVFAHYRYLVVEYRMIFILADVHCIEWRGWRDWRGCSTGRR